MKTLPSIDLAEFISDMNYELYDLDANAPEPQLTCARFADHMRDLDRDPLAFEDFQVATMDLDDEGTKRLALLIEGVMQNEEIEAHIVAKRLSASALLESHLVHMARSKSLLPLELMKLSPIRLEEFARGFLAGLDIPIIGEKPEQSAQRLAEIDYESLLGEADRAEQAAAERLAELRRIQEEERAAFDRSKW